MNLFLSRGAALGLALFTIVSVALTLFFSAKFGGPAVRTSKPFTITTTLDDAQGVASGSDVLVHGVKVGRVGHASSAGATTTLKLELTDDAPRLLHPDAVARIGTKTPLGESFVDLDPGRAAGGVRTGGRIAARATVQLDEALEVLDPGARKDLAAVLREIGRGSRSPVAGARLGGTVDGLDAVVERLRALTRTLQGQSGDIAATVQGGRAVLSALATRDAGIHALVADARRTLDGAGADPVALRAGLRELPALTRQVSLTLQDADGLIADARGPVGDLRRAAAPLAAALRAAPAPLAGLGLVLNRAQAVREAALPTLASLQRTLPVLTPTVRALGPALANVVPMLDYLAPRSRTIAAWFTNTDDLGRGGDAKGRWARFFVGLDPHTGFGVKGGPAQNPYTQPGDAAANQAYAAGDFPQLKPFQPALLGTGPVVP
ncbi:MAG: virulence factor Mce [Solirubrobacterales bacterium]|nr:virulence factor Mce [Solirubrobacterales bacterium]